MTVGDGFAPGTTKRLEAWIYNGNIYRKCNTSPTKACVGFLSKEYAGALTGWSFDFGDTETPLKLKAGSPIIGGWDVVVDEALSTPCKKVKVLKNPEGGLNEWTACTWSNTTFGVSYSEINSQFMKLPPFDGGE